MDEPRRQGIAAVQKRLDEVTKNAPADAVGQHITFTITNPKVRPVAYTMFLANAVKDVQFLLHQLKIRESK